MELLINNFELIGSEKALFKFLLLTGLWEFLAPANLFLDSFGIFSQIKFELFGSLKHDIY